MPRKVANGNAIRSIRELAGYSQAAFAGEIGVSRPALAKVEAGGGMRPGNIKRAAKALGVPVTSLTMTVLTPAEVCAALHITADEFFQLVATGELVIASGGDITEAALEEYIARQLPELAATP